MNGSRAEGNHLHMDVKSPLLIGCVSLVAVLAAAGCGGSGKSSSGTGSVAGTQSTLTTASPAAEKAQVKQVWTQFFASSTPPKTKASLLQNGSMFLPAIQAQSKSPLAGKSIATVSRVTLKGPAKATVIYSIDLAGKPALTHQTGVAIRVGGAWKVGDASFCSLLKLGGAPPSACK